jgi:hypothetical protein
MLPPSFPNNLGHRDSVQCPPRRHQGPFKTERKAAMVSNLMVVLCGESEVHPVVNTGTLYT